MKKFYKIQRILEGLSLIGIGDLIIYYYINNKLIFFVYPFYNKLILISAIFVVFIGCFKIIKKEEISCHHNNLTKNLSILLLFCIAIYGFYNEPKPLSSSTALTRGISTEIDVSSNSLTSLSFLPRPEDRKLIDWVRALNMDPEPSKYIGQKVKLNGFIIIDETISSDHFYIAKFMISCCAADARPLAMLVKYDSSKLQIGNDMWIELEGTFIEEDINGQRTAVINANNIKEIPIPENPYEY